jgi:hypothetical protein
MDKKYIIEYDLYIYIGDDYNEILELYGHGVVYIIAISEDFALAKFHCSFAEDVKAEVTSIILKP